MYPNFKCLLLVIESLTPKDIQWFEAPNSYFEYELKFKVFHIYIYFEYVLKFNARLKSSSIFIH